MFGDWENSLRCQHSLPRQGTARQGPPTVLPQLWPWAGQPEAETGAVCATLAYRLRYSASGNRLASVFPGFNHIPGINVAVAAHSTSSSMGSPAPASPGQPTSDCHKRGSQGAGTHSASLRQESAVWFLFIQQFPVVRE